jgi:fructose-bisphosphate aldolase class II
MIMTGTKGNRTLAKLNAATAAATASWPPSRGYHPSSTQNSTLTAPRYNIEHLTALVRAAESKRSPLIIQLFPSALKQVPPLAHAAAHALKTASVPLSSHIDHAQNVEHIREIIATLPVDSVTVDMSHYDEAENLAKMKVLTKECHDKGIAVEAESGRINGVKMTLLIRGILKVCKSLWIDATRRKQD